MKDEEENQKRIASLVREMSSPNFDRDRARKMSRDATPNIDNYRTRFNVQATVRPSMQELYSITGGHPAVSQNNTF